MIRLILADIPKKWSDIPEKIINDVKNLPSEVGDTAEHLKNLDDEIHNLKITIDSINRFTEKFQGAYEGIIEILNTPIYDLVDAIYMPFTYIMLVVGTMFLVFGLPKWGSKLCKTGFIGFFVAQIFMVITRGFATS